MARIFTTKFTFNHQVYDAIVTVISSDGTVNFNVKVLDDELQQLIPGGRIRYQEENGLSELSSNDQMTHSLMRSIARSIEEHLVDRI